MHHIPFHNHEIPVLAAEVVAFSFAIYGFNSGHFTSHRGAPPFQIAIAADARPMRQGFVQKKIDMPHYRCVRRWPDAICRLVKGNIYYSWILHPFSPISSKRNGKEVLVGASGDSESIEGEARVSHAMGFHTYTQAAIGH